MATEEEVQAARERVDSLRAQIAEAKALRDARAEAMQRDDDLRILGDEEARLKAELAAEQAVNADMGIEQVVLPGDDQPPTPPAQQPPPNDQFQSSDGSTDDGGVN